MRGESLFGPIQEDALRAARSRLVLAGQTIDQWADANGVSRANAHDVLGGRRRAIRGECLRIAIKLGLRPDPTHPAPQQPVQPPAGRTEEPAVDAFHGGSSIAGGPPVVASDRRPVSQLGEAVR